MNVTTAARLLAEKQLELATWPSLLPQHVYNLEVPRIASGRSLDLGEQLHAKLHQFWGGTWIDPDYYYTCAAIEDVLIDLGLDRGNLKTELPVSGNGLNGQVDICGSLSDGRSAVIEIKSTQGEYALPPSSRELCQLALYSSLLKYDAPTLICLRVNFRLRKVSAFVMSDASALIANVELEASALNAA